MNKVNKLAIKLEEYGRIWNRNKIPISFCMNQVKNNCVNLQYCNSSNNVGDLLAPIVHSYMLDKKGISYDHFVKQTMHIYEIGSIIDFGMQDATIWGSGVLSAQAKYDIKKGKRIGRRLDIRSVRGPYTRNLLREVGYECPEIYGDPAVLMPLIYKPSKVKKRNVSLIVHKNGRFSAKVEKYKDILIDINTDDYKKVIDAIASSEVVISSSLHGIILAESYGVPTILLAEDVMDQMFKFYDWFSSTGRIEFAIASSVESALKMEPTPLPKLDQMREIIMRVFPYDLYECGRSK